MQCYGYGQTSMKVEEDSVIGMEAWERVLLCRLCKRCVAANVIDISERSHQERSRGGRPPYKILRYVSPSKIRALESAMLQMRSNLGSPKAGTYNNLLRETNHSGFPHGACISVYAGFDREKATRSFRACGRAHSRFGETAFREGHVSGKRFGMRND